MPPRSLLHLLATALVFRHRAPDHRSPVGGRVSRRCYSVCILLGHEVVAWVSGNHRVALRRPVSSPRFSPTSSRASAGRSAGCRLSCLLYAAGSSGQRDGHGLAGPDFRARLAVRCSGAESGEPLTSWQRLFQAVGRASVYLPVAILYLVVRIQVLHGFSHAQNVVRVLDAAADPALGPVFLSGSSGCCRSGFRNSTTCPCGPAGTCSTSRFHWRRWRGRWALCGTFDANLARAKWPLRLVGHGCAAAARPEPVGVRAW